MLPQFLSNTHYEIIQMNASEIWCTHCLVENNLILTRNLTVLKIFGLQYMLNKFCIHETQQIKQQHELDKTKQ